MNDKKKVVGVLVILAAVIGAGVVYYGIPLYEGYQARQEYKALEKSFVDAWTADTYGGKTPQETLDMFIDALKAGDVEKVTDLFVLQDDLTKDNARISMQTLKDNGVFPRMVEDIEEYARPDPHGPIDENDFKFALITQDGTTGAIINMRLNTYARVWKIEGF